MSATVIAPEKDSATIAKDGSVLTVTYTADDGESPDLEELVGVVNEYIRIADSRGKILVIKFFLQ